MNIWFKSSEGFSTLDSLRSLQVASISYLILNRLIGFFCILSCHIVEKKYAIAHTIENWRLSSIKGCIPSKFVFDQSPSSEKGCIPSMIMFHQRFLTSKVVFNQRSPSIKSLSSIKGCLPSNVYFDQRSSLSKVVFHQVKSMCIIPDLYFTSFSKFWWGSCYCCCYCCYPF